MNKKIGILSLALLGLSVTQASAQLVVTAPVLEVQSGVQTGLQGTMKALSSAANKLVSAGVKEQELTKMFSEKNMLMAKNWYDGLLSISSAVRDYRRVKNIFEKQTQIIQQYSSAIEVLRKSPFIKPQQLADMTTMYGKMLLESSNTIGDLQTIVSPAMLKMTDAERMRFIDQLDKKITDQSGLVNYYTQRNLMMMRVAKEQAQDLESLKNLMSKR
ncbi:MULTISPECIES: hypothetical protein [Hymenobacter]|uniref:Conjugal transfer protein TraI n=1 Tax=Hymenobacter mucosus TaxID=1411120 RepID=A0A239AWR0_9BACT|nr:MULTISPECIES: hypothetical protein [Hymenobacter]MDF7815519.1 hypothetical protein [Hymenobacter sp. YC55]SNS00156.1 hypothetical protein SAMN06269173_11616 [Hymenobacter mucosus]